MTGAADSKGAEDERRMTDLELLDAAIDLCRRQHAALTSLHRRHGGSGAFEDVCCRLVTGATSVLAEAERRDVQHGTDG